MQLTEGHFRGHRGAVERCDPVAGRTIWCSNRWGEGEEGEEEGRADWSQKKGSLDLGVPFVGGIEGINISSQLCVLKGPLELNLRRFICLRVSNQGKDDGVVVGSGLDFQELVPLVGWVWFHLAVPFLGQ